MKRLKVRLTCRSGTWDKGTYCYVNAEHFNAATTHTFVRLIDKKGKYSINLSKKKYLHIVPNKRNKAILSELNQAELPFIDVEPIKVKYLPINGMKFDDAKPRPSLLLDDMKLAVNEVIKVLDFGAKKYGPGNWLLVDNAITRYTDAKDRHRLATDVSDEESGLLHAAHEAANALFILELKLRDLKG